ncbi:MAG: S8 family serine peptidase, partial [Bacteroidales bacterium]|nr:S8 family serine peptidase [Bacteroidales bacterium]
MKNKIPIISFLLIFILTNTLKSQEMYFPDDINLDSTVNIIVEFNETSMFYNQTKSVASYQYVFAEFYSDLDSIIQNDTLVKSMQYSATREYYKLFTGVSLSVPLYLKFQIKNLPYVKEIYEDYEVQGTLDESVGLLNVDDVWTVNCKTGIGIIIAILDTGIDYNHEALGGGSGIFPNDKVIGGYDFVNNDLDPMDDETHGHGTHVAGIVAANSDDLKGIAPGASLLIYKVLNQEGFGTCSDILAGIEAAMDPDGNGDYSDHADIINMSLGSSYGSYNDILSTKVEEAIQNFDVVFCIAAGNNNTGSATGYGSVASPGVAPSAITVGACTKEENSLMAQWSLKGPSRYLNTIKPEIVAPGVDISSCLFGTVSGTQLMSGTSQATPMIAGICALIKEEHPDWNAYQIKSAMISTATLLFDENENLYDAMTQGSGRVDAFAAINTSTFFDRLDNEGNIEGNDLSFGLVNSLELPYTKTIQIRVTNVNENIQNYTIDLQTSNLPTGVNLTCSNPNFQLLANQSTIIEFTLEVYNTIASYTRIFSGNILITGDYDTNLHLPWAFVKNQIIWVDDDAVAPFLGTESQPMKTIGSATFWAQNFDYVIVKEGVYEPFENYKDYLVITSEYIFNQSNEVITNTIINTSTNSINLYVSTDISGFHITGNKSKKGIYCPNLSRKLTLENLIIEKNIIGIYSNSAVEIKNCEIVDCGISGQVSYGIICGFSNVFIDNTTLVQNNADIVINLANCFSEISNLIAFDNTGTDAIIKSNNILYLKKSLIFNNSEHAIKISGGIANLYEIEIYNTNGIYNMNGNNHHYENVYFHDNYSGPVLNFLNNSKIINCIFDNNIGYISILTTDIENCVFTNNKKYMSNEASINFEGNAFIKNSIFYNNENLKLIDYNSPTVTSNFNNITDNIIIDAGMFINQNSISTNPLFSHDIVPYGLSPNSPCIDAGDPASDFHIEPMSHGCRINMGAYGNTPYAVSKENAQNYALYPYQNNFETGIIDDFWSLSGNTDVVTETGNGANNTDSWIKMQTGNNKVKLFINLENTEYPDLIFYSKTDGITNPDDGIYFANDCDQNYLKVADLPYYTEWAKQTLNIRNLAAKNDIDVNESFSIMFKYTGDNSFYSIDEIQVEELNMPVLNVNAECNPVEFTIDNYNTEYTYVIHYKQCQSGTENIITDANQSEFVTFTEEGCYKLWLQIITSTGSIYTVPIEESVYFTAPTTNEVTLSLASSYNSGDPQATYTLSVTNLTTETYNNIVLQSDLPETDLTFVPGGDFTLIDDPNEIISTTIPSLGPNQTLNLTFTVDIIDYQTQSDITVCVESVSGACNLSACNTTDVSALEKYIFTVEEEIKCEGTIIGYYLSGSDIGVWYYLVKQGNENESGKERGDGDEIVFNNVTNVHGTYEVFADWKGDNETKMDGEETVYNYPLPQDDLVVIGSTVCQGDYATITVFDAELNATYELDGLTPDYTELNNNNWIFYISTDELSGVYEPIHIKAISEHNCERWLLNTATIIVNPLPDISNLNVNVPAITSLEEETQICLDNTSSVYDYVVYVNGNPLDPLQGTNEVPLCFDIPNNMFDPGNNHITIEVLNSETGCSSVYEEEFTICVFKQGTLLDLQNISGINIYEDETYLISEDVELNSGTNLIFNNCTVNFWENTKVTVNPNSKFVANNTVLTSENICIENNKWQGIEVSALIHKETGSGLYGVVNIRNNSTVSNAKIAVKSDKGGVIIAENSSFIDNQTDIYIVNYFNPFRKCRIDHNTFQTTENFLPLAKTFYHIYLSHADVVNLRGNTFENTEEITNIFERGNGVFSANTDLTIIPYCSSSFITPCPPQNTYPNVFSNLNKAITIRNDGLDYLTKIESNEFSNNATCIFVSGASPKIVLNDFNIPFYQKFITTGVFTESCTSYQIEENEFIGIHGLNNFGLVVRNSGTASNEIYKNTFTNLYVACEAQGNNGIRELKGGLQFICNEFNSTSNDIFVTKYVPDETIEIIIPDEEKYDYQYGIAEFQGSKERSAGNKFSHYFNDLVNSQAPFYYFYDNEPNSEPVHYTNETVFPKLVSNANQCPSHLTTPLPTWQDLLVLSDSIDAKQGYLYYLIDAGNTSDLLEEIENTDPPEINRLRRLLLSLSPDLSDTSMVSAIDYELGLPPVVLTSILSANPRAPKSGKVMQALINCSHPLPPPFMAEVLLGRDSLSHQEAVASNLGGYISEKNRTINEIARYLRSDTVSTTASDSLVLLLATDNTLNSDYMLVSYYLYLLDIDNSELI